MDEPLRVSIWPGILASGDAGVPRVVAGAACVSDGQMMRLASALLASQSVPHFSQRERRFFVSYMTESSYPRFSGCEPQITSRVLAALAGRHHSDGAFVGN